MITEESCERTIKQIFGSLANELRLELVRLRKFHFKDDSPYLTLLGVPESNGGTPVQFYEIVSPHLSLRIRVGVGPWTDRETTSLVVSLVPSGKRPDTWDDLGSEIGVHVVAAYYGETTDYQDIFSPKDFEDAARQSARIAQQYCKPFLLGQMEDFPKIRQQLDEEIRQEKARIEGLLANLPPNVKPMWKREGESHAEWMQRLDREKRAWESEKSAKRKGQTNT